MSSAIGKRILVGVFVTVISAVIIEKITKGT